MKTVKYLFIIMAAMFVISSASAQSPKQSCKLGSEACIKEKCSKFATALQLTEQQSKQVMEIMAKYEKQNQTKREQIGKLSKELSDSRTAQKGEIEALLNPSQKAAYEQVISKRGQFERQAPRHFDMHKKACVCKDCKEGCSKECAANCNKAKGDCANCTKECPKKK